MPISGAYAEFVRLPQRELVTVPAGLDPAEAVSLILNYITAYQMLHRSAKVTSGQSVLIHAAAGGVGTAPLQLGRLAGLEMYGTCSARTATVVSDLGGIPIDYQNQDFVKEIRRVTRDGVDAVFDGIGGDNLWRSRETLRADGTIVVYGFTSKLSGGRFGIWPGRWPPSFSRIRDPRLVHRSQPVSPRPETDGSVLHPVAQALETGPVPTGFDRPV